MMIAMISWKVVWGLRYPILIACVVGGFALLIHQNRRMEVRYLKQMAELNTTIADMRTANLEAMRQQQEYIAGVYKETSKLNESIRKDIGESNHEIENWNDEFIAALSGRLREDLKGDIYSSTASALNDSRTAIRNSAELLNRKFSAQVSENIVRLISDAERNRVALGQCIAYADGVKQIVEQNNKGKMPIKKGSK